MAHSTLFLYVAHVMILRYSVLVSIADGWFITSQALGLCLDDVTQLPLELLLSYRSQCRE